MGKHVDEIKETMKKFEEREAEIRNEYEAIELEIRRATLQIKKYEDELKKLDVKSVNNTTYSNDYMDSTRHENVTVEQSSIREAIKEAKDKLERFEKAKKLSPEQERKLNDIETEKMKFYTQAKPEYEDELRKVNRSLERYKLDIEDLEDKIRDAKKKDPKAEQILKLTEKLEKTKEKYENLKEAISDIEETIQICDEQKKVIEDKYNEKAGRINNILNGREPSEKEPENNEQKDKKTENADLENNNSNNEAPEKDTPKNEETGDKKPKDSEKPENKKEELRQKEDELIAKISKEITKIMSDKKMSADEKKEAQKRIKDWKTELDKIDEILKEGKEIEESKDILPEDKKVEESKEIIPEDKKVKESEFHLTPDEIRALLDGFSPKDKEVEESKDIISEDKKVEESEGISTEDEEFEDSESKKENINYAEQYQALSSQINEEFTNFQFAKNKAQVEEGIANIKKYMEEIAKLSDKTEEIFAEISQEILVQQQRSLIDMLKEESDEIEEYAKDIQNSTDEEEKSELELTKKIMEIDYEVKFQATSFINRELERRDEKIEESKKVEEGTNKKEEHGTDEMLPGMVQAPTIVRKGFFGRIWNGIKAFGRKILKLPGTIREYVKAGDEEIRGLSEDGDKDKTDRKTDDCIGRKDPGHMEEKLNANQKENEEKREENNKFKVSGVDGKFDSSRKTAPRSKDNDERTIK